MSSLTISAYFPSYAEREFAVSKVTCGHDVCNNCCCGAHGHALRSVGHGTRELTYEGSAACFMFSGRCESVVGKRLHDRVALRGVFCPASMVRCGHEFCGGCVKRVGEALDIMFSVRAAGHARGSDTRRRPVPGGRPPCTRRGNLSAHLRDWALDVDTCEFGRAMNKRGSPRLESWR